MSRYPLYYKKLEQHSSQKLSNYVTKTLRCKHILYVAQNRLFYNTKDISNPSQLGIGNVSSFITSLLSQQRGYNDKLCMLTISQTMDLSAMDTHSILLYIDNETNEIYWIDNITYCAYDDFYEILENELKQKGYFMYFWGTGVNKDTDIEKIEDSVLGNCITWSVLFAHVIEKCDWNYFSSYFIPIIIRDSPIVTVYNNLMMQVILQNHRLEKEDNKYYGNINIYEGFLQIITENKLQLNNYILSVINSGEIQSFLQTIYTIYWSCSVEQYDILL